jgi:hypothetical protein
MRRLEEPPVRPDGLQLDENRTFQERHWTAERWAWGGFIAVTLAAALGTTGGGGVLSHGLAEMEGGAIDRPRITRWAASDQMNVHFDAGSGERSLALSAGFAQSFQVESMQPRPVRAAGTPEGQRLTFAAADGPFEVVVHLRAQHPGLARWRARIDGGAPRDFTTLVLP